MTTIDHSMREQPHRPCPSFWNWSTWLMIGLVACFTVQQIVIVQMEKPYDVYLALSGYGMKSGHLWELLTYQCFHRGWAHLLLNLVGLWFIGRKVEQEFGPTRFFLLYQGAVLAGALLQGGVAVGGFLLPESLDSVATVLRDRFGGPVSGSSVGLCGVFAALCWSDPERRIRLFFCLPIKASVLCWVGFGVAILLVILPTDPSLAHLAHSGGYLTGMIFGRLGRTKPPRAG